MVSKDSIGIDKDLTKSKICTHSKCIASGEKGSARFLDRKARNRLFACHCIAGNHARCKSTHRPFWKSHVMVIQQELGANLTSRQCLDK